jgi:hypothetical protein
MISTLRECVTLSRLRAHAILAGLVAVAVTCVADVSPAAEKVSLTVYNRDLAFVRDRREISLKEGVNEISISGVPSKVDPSSVRVSFPSGGRPARILSQNYRYNVADTDRLLELGLGERITVRVRGGELIRGALIGYDSQSLVVREETSMIRESDEAIIVVGRSFVIDVRFPDIGRDLELRPTLLWLMQGVARAKTEMEVSYLTTGMGWGAEYVAALSEQEGAMELSAWASLDNKSGGDFQDASLTLVAGEISRAKAAPPVRMEMMAGRAPETDFGQEEFSEYHAYTLDRPITIKNNESVQVPLLAPADVQVERTYTYDGSRYRGVRVTVKAENTPEAGLGRALPAGRVRIYAAAAGVEPRLAGEDMLANTPAGAEFELQVGTAFDVEGDRTRTAYDRLGKNDFSESYKIALKNSKSVPVEVVVVEHPRGDWTITESSAPYEEKDSSTVQWTVTVPASGELAVSYTVQIRS